jgi:hypothetical protein
MSRQEEQFACLLEVLLKAVLVQEPGELTASLVTYSSSKKVPDWRSCEDLSAEVDAAVQFLKEERSSFARKIRDLQESSCGLEDLEVELRTSFGSLDRAVTKETDSLRIELEKERRLAREAMAKAEQEKIEADARHFSELQSLHAQLRAAELCVQDVTSAPASPTLHGLQKDDLATQVVQWQSQLIATEKKACCFAEQLAASIAHCAELQKQVAELQQAHDSCRFCGQRSSRDASPQGMRSVDSESPSILGNSAHQAKVVRPSTADGLPNRSRHAQLLDSAVPARPSSALPKSRSRESCSKAERKTADSHTPGTLSVCSTRPSTRSGNYASMSSQYTSERASPLAIAEPQAVHESIPRSTSTSPPPQSVRARPQPLGTPTDNGNALLQAAARSQPAKPSSNLAKKCEAEKGRNLWAETGKSVRLRLEQSARERQTLFAASPSKSACSRLEKFEGISFEEFERRLAAASNTKEQQAKRLADTIATQKTDKAAHQVIVEFSSQVAELVKERKKEHGVSPDIDFGMTSINDLWTELQRKRHACDQYTFENSFRSEPPDIEPIQTPYPVRPSSAPSHKRPPKVEPTYQTPDPVRPSSAPSQKRGIAIRSRIHYEELI